MTTRDPGNRFWRSFRGAVALTVVIWTVVTVLFGVTGFLMAMPDGFEGGPTWGAWAAGLAVGTAGVVFLSVAVPDFGGTMAPLFQCVRFAGSMAAGIGGGAMACVVVGRADRALLWAPPVAALGVLLVLSPVLVTAYRSSLQRHRDDIRLHGASSPGVVTGTWTFVEDETWVRYRATIRFTDTSGTQRWFKRLAPKEILRVAEGDAVTVHFDPEHPGHRRSISVDWNNAAANRATGRRRQQRGPRRLP